MSEEARDPDQESQQTVMAKMVCFSHLFLCLDLFFYVYVWPNEMSWRFTWVYIGEKGKFKSYLVYLWSNFR